MATTKKHSARKTTKTLNKNKLLSYQPTCHTKTSHQNFKTVASEHTITLLSLLNLNFQFYQCV